jgi:cytochrome c biogenesis protein CcmG, thiol:disulfide interchange protein DsbE
MSDEENLQPTPRTISTATWVTLAVAAVLIVGWLAVVRPRMQQDRATKNPGVGQPLPVLELLPLTGATEGISLEKLRGKVVLVNYWGTWCQPCAEEFPHMLELWEQLRGKPEFAFISVSSTFADHEAVAAVRDETAAFLKSRSTTMPTYIDVDGVSRQTLAGVIGMQGMAYPTTVILDRAGIIRGVWVGFDSGDQQQMEQLISKLLMETK